MGTKQIQVTGELWQEICTAGWECGAGLQDGMRCTEGLPEGARFCGVSYIHHGIQGWGMFRKAERPEFPNILIFIFEHPDWPEVGPGEDVPIINVVHEKTHEEPSYGYEGIN